MTEYLRENRFDPEGEYVEVWSVPPPPVGQKYQVIRAQWNALMTERHIYEVKVHPPGG